MSGEVRLRYRAGRVHGRRRRRSEHSLYDLSLATYGSEDAFDQSHAEGYVRLYGLPLKVWSATQGHATVTDASRSSEGDAGSSGQLWAGRFSTPPAPEADALGRSLSFDVRLAPHDVEAGVAHVRALQDAGLLSPAEAGALEEALADVGNEIGEGRFAFDDADEDVHSAIERAVTDRLGDLGAKLHAGRSRNDLVVTDLRLWLLAAGRRIDAGLGLAGRDARRSRARARGDRDAGNDARTVRAAGHARPSPAGARLGVRARPRAVRRVGGADLDLAARCGRDRPRRRSGSTPT